MWETVSITGWEEFVPPILKPIRSKFGLGWAVGEVDGHFIADHVGADEGYLAAMELAPDDGIAVVINSNYFDDVESNTRVWEITAEIMQTLLSTKTEAASSNIVYYAAAQGMDNINPAIGENYSVNNALISLYDALFIVRRGIRWRTIWWRASKLCQMPVNLPSSSKRMPDSTTAVR